MPPSDTMTGPRGQSARATTAAESRFRICAPNSLPRRVLVVAVDRPGALLVRRLAARPWGNAVFVIASAVPAPAADRRPQLVGRLSALDGGLRDLADEVAGSDLVVLIGSAGQDPRAASVVGRACREAGVTSTALVVDDGTAAGAGRAAQLAALRPYCHMLVIITTDDLSVADESPAAVLSALRA